MTNIAESSNNPITLIKARLRQDYIKNAQLAEAAGYLASLDTEGKWPDLDYADTVRTAWPPLRHLVRLADISAAYLSEGHAFYRSADVLAAVIRGLSFWYARQPTSLNWWQNKIGQPLQLMRILCLLGDELPAEIFSQGVSYLNDPALMKANLTTGQNLLWFASELLLRGLLTDTEEDIARASAYLQNEIRISLEEGIQPDYSFHQHGAQLYNGGYGLNFIMDGSYYADILHGTPWAYSPEKLGILTDYLLKGQAAMLRGAWLDFSACGREPSRKTKHQSARLLLEPAERMARCQPERAAELQALCAHILGQGTPALHEENRYFWRSEFMVHQRAAYYLSIRMNSARMVGTELINNENIKGCWLPFGLTYIVRRGDEYDHIWPLWDWARLPGVTSPHTLFPLDKWHGQSEETFVGGVSDGRYGAATMVLDKQNTRAHKSWFCFENEVVALGAGITCSDANPVATTLNQTRQCGQVWIDGHIVTSSEAVLQQPLWVWHDQVAYLPLDPANAVLGMKQGAQSGGWKSINDQYAFEEISADIFTVWLEHGLQPQNASYAYLIAPGIDVAAVADYQANLPIRILANTTTLQAVRHDGLQLSQIVFYQAGSIALHADATLTVDQPCVVQVQEAAGQMARIAIANPESTAMEINVELSGKQAQRWHFSLQGDAQGGATQQVGGLA